MQVDLGVGRVADPVVGCADVDAGVVAGDAGDDEALPGPLHLPARQHVVLDKTNIMSKDSDGQYSDSSMCKFPPSEEIITG